MWRCRPIGIILICFLPGWSRAEVSLPKFFADHMVLQRDKVIRIWGWASPDEKIEVTFAHGMRKTTTSKDGHWSVLFPEQPAGGPFTLQVVGKNRMLLNDILIGDVWLASGQSNMQWTIDQTSYQEVDTVLLKRDHIRLFTVGIDTDYLPRKDVKGGSWRNVNPASIGNFSAVAYHFSRHLHRNLDIPIGIINCSLGATTIETWMSNESLMTFPQFRTDIQPILDLGLSAAELNAAFRKQEKSWQDQGYLTGPGMEEAWYLTATKTTDWSLAQVPGTWETQGFPDHDGAMWYRKTFDRPAHIEGDSFLLRLSQIDDYDITWINGYEVGRSYGRHNHRNYSVASHLLRKHDNTIVIRAFDIGHDGGFTTNAFWMSPMIRGEWYIKPGLAIDADNFYALPSVNITPFSSPGVLFNANIAPLTDLSIKGVIWYQGESNAERAHEYAPLFQSLITDWRKQWNDDALPFLFVQLANYGKESPHPGHSSWAELREAQAKALRLPHTGMAVTIDIGEADDIHPKNKEAVGKRLGIAALSIAYQQNVCYVGPTPGHISYKKGRASISFHNMGSGLITRSKHGYIHGFEMAGRDQQFHWASATIAGDQVVLSCPEVLNPIAVRYAWSDNPGVIDLYNQEGLPAAPFRTDSWPGITHGITYDHRKPRF